MKKALFILALLGLSWNSVLPDIRTFQAPGKTISPVYDHRGHLVFLYERPGYGIFLGDSSNPLHVDPRFHTQTITGDARLPCLKKDPAGRLWAIWEQSLDGIESVYLARIDGSAITDKRRVNSFADGMNVSPDFDFDLAGNIWVTWINRSEGLCRVLVTDTANTHTWSVDNSPTLSFYTPRILASSTSMIWIFWVSQGVGHYRICCRFFNGQQWSEVSVLNQDTTLPHLLPEITLDELGHPWVVWSGYDGKDYEIWYTSWDGNRWLSARRLTNNRDRSDLSPTILFLMGNIPLISWSQQGNTSQILAKINVNGSWSPDTCLVQGEGFNRNPKIALEGGILCLSWENVHRDTELVKVKEIELYDLFRRETAYSRREERFLPYKELREKDSASHFQQELRENQYIAFGDSITYGVLARMWFPDKGYVPRLELLLKPFIDGARVLNRGEPGEQTWEGLARMDDVLEESGSKYILIMEGTNDMTGSIPSETAAFNLEEMVKKCLNAGVYPLMATVIPRSDALWKQRVQEPTLKLNGLIREMLPTYSLPLVDQYAQFMNYPEGYLALFSDGAHPNETGYQLMAETWFDQIQHVPYPPIKFKAERKLNQILFYDEHLNLLQWEANPLWAPGQHISAFRIYRKFTGNDTENFELIAVLPQETYEFVDRNIDQDKAYLYFIQSEGPTGIRGPASNPVGDR